jgi:hypothetical protein
VDYYGVSPPDGGDLREQHECEFLAWLRKRHAEYGKPNGYSA